MKKKKETIRTSRKIFLACDRPSKAVWKYLNKPTYDENEGQFFPARGESAASWNFVRKEAVEFLLGRMLEPGELAEVDIVSKAVISRENN